MKPVEKNIHTLFQQTDARNWKAVEQTFAPQVTLDYTSMAGGEPAQVTPQEITDSWKSLLPGFESTEHKIQIIDSTYNGGRATAKVKGIASHYLSNEEGEDAWIVEGTYDFELEQVEGLWKIRLMRFNLQKQSGNNQLPALAQEG